MRSISHEPESAAGGPTESGEKRAVGLSGFDAGVVREMVVKGLVKEHPDGKLSLTQLGVHEAFLNVSFRAVSPVPVADLHADKPLEDASSFELVRRLGQGWEWRPLQKPKKRRLALEFVAYVPGGQKYWRTTPKEVNAAYLRCLLRADDLFAAGCPYVPHGQRQDVYDKLLGGRHGCLRDLTLQDAPLDQRLSLDVDTGGAHVEAEAEGNDSDFAEANQEEPWVDDWMQALAEALLPEAPCLDASDDEPLLNLPPASPSPPLPPPEDPNAESGRQSAGEDPNAELDKLPQLGH